jgi:hypothetical protein
MTAGRELDALVAEKVFGHKITWEDSQEDDGKDDAYVLNPDGETYKWSNFVPHYSTDIAAAFEVVNVVTAGQSLSLQINYDESDGEVRVEFRGQGVFPDGREEGGCHKEVGGLKYLPHAICLAALKAVGA